MGFKEPLLEGLERRIVGQVRQLVDVHLLHQGSNGEDTASREALSERLGIGALTEIELANLVVPPDAVEAVGRFGRCDEFGLRAAECGDPLELRASDDARIAAAINGGPLGIWVRRR